MESWCIMIQGIHTPTPQRVEFFRFLATQCTGKSNSHWVDPGEVHCDRNSSYKCWRCWAGACPLHPCQDRRREHPIRRGRNVHELEQHSAGGTRSSSTVQVFTLDYNGCQVRKPTVEPNSAIAYTLPSSIDSKHTNSNAHCNPTRGCIRCYDI